MSPNRIIGRSPYFISASELDPLILDPVPDVLPIAADDIPIDHRALLRSRGRRQGRTGRERVGDIGAKDRERGTKDYSKQKAHFTVSLNEIRNELCRR